jgi:hypothetical protein
MADLLNKLLPRFETFISLTDDDGTHIVPACSMGTFPELPEEDHLNHIINTASSELEKRGEIYDIGSLVTQKCLVSDTIELWGKYLNTKYGYSPIECISPYVSAGLLHAKPTTKKSLTKRMTSNQDVTYFFPMNNSLVPKEVGHWILLACHPLTRTISVYNSLLTYPSQPLVDALLVYMHSIFPNKEWNVEHKITPQQKEESLDCGVITCLVMWFLIIRCPLFLMLEHDMKEWRKTMAFQMAEYFVQEQLPPTTTPEKDTPIILSTPAKQAKDDDVMILPRAADVSLPQKLAVSSPKQRKTIPQKPKSPQAATKQTVPEKPKSPQPKAVISPKKTIAQKPKSPTKAATKQTVPEIPKSPQPKAIQKQAEIISSSNKKRTQKIPGKRNIRKLDIEEEEVDRYAEPRTPVTPKIAQHEDSDKLNLTDVHIADKKVDRHAEPQTPVTPKIAQHASSDEDIEDSDVEIVDFPGTDAKPSTAKRSTPIPITTAAPSRFRVAGDKPKHAQPAKSPRKQTPIPEEEPKPPSPKEKKSPPSSGRKSPPIAQAPREKIAPDVPTPVDRKSLVLEPPVGFCEMEITPEQQSEVDQFAKSHATYSTVFGPKEINVREVLDNAWSAKTMEAFATLYERTSPMKFLVFGEFRNPNPVIVLRDSTTCVFVNCATSRRDNPHWAVVIVDAARFEIECLCNDECKDFMNDAVRFIISVNDLPFNLRIHDLNTPVIDTGVATFSHAKELSRRKAGCAIQLEYGPSRRALLYDLMHGTQQILWYERRRKQLFENTIKFLKKGFVVFLHREHSRRDFSTAYNPAKVQDYMTQYETNNDLRGVALVPEANDNYLFIYGPEHKQISIQAKPLADTDPHYSIQAQIRYALHKK